MSQSICASTARHPPARASGIPTGSKPSTGLRPPPGSQARYRLRTSENPSAPADPCKCKSSSQTYLQFIRRWPTKPSIVHAVPWLYPDMWSPIEPRHKRMATYSSKTIGSTLSKNCHKVDRVASATALSCRSDSGGLPGSGRQRIDRATAAPRTPRHRISRERDRSLARASAWSRGVVKQPVSRG